MEETTTTFRLTGEPERKARRMSLAQRFVRDFYAAFRAAGVETAVRIDYARDTKLAKELIEGFRRALLDPEEAVPQFIAAALADEWFRGRVRPDFKLAARCANVLSKQVEAAANVEDREARQALVRLARELDADPVRLARVRESLARAREVEPDMQWKLLPVPELRNVIDHDAARHWRAASPARGDDRHMGCEFLRFRKVQQEWDRALRVVGVTNLRPLRALLDAAMTPQQQARGRAAVEAFPARMTA